MYIQDGLGKVPYTSMEGLASSESIIDRIKSALVSKQMPLALALAVLSGIRDVNQLTNMIFFARHTDRSGRKLDPKEPGFKELSKEWLQIRDTLVIPALQKIQPAGTTPSNGRAGPARQVPRGRSVSAGGYTATERRLHVSPPPLPSLQNVPDDLEYYKSRNNLLDAQALLAYQKMVQAARADGIPSPFLKLVSGYRSYERQSSMWKGRLLTKFSKNGCPEASLPCIGHAINRTTDALRSMASTIWPLRKNTWLDRFVIELNHGGCNTGCNPRKVVGNLQGGTAPPGSSAHETGRALDIHVGGTLSRESDNVNNQRRQSAYHWLVRNAKRFGFYPYAPEPWHWEYNPPA